MNIIVVGSTGTFAEMMMDRLYKEGHRIFVLTREKNSQYRGRKVFEVYRFPYENPCVKDVVESVRPDVILYLGAFDRSYRWEDKEEEVSYVAGLTNLLSDFAEQGSGRFVYLSCDEVFQAGEEQPLTEESPCNPRTLKGRASAIGEKLCLDYREMTQTDILVLRLNGMYEKPVDLRETGNLCAQMCIEGLETGELIVNPKDKVSLLYASDAVEFVYRAMTAKEHRHSLYQISSDEIIETKELAKMICDSLTANVQVIEDEERQTEAVFMDSSEYEDEFGIRILHKAEETVPKVAEQIETHPADFCRTTESKERFGTKWKRNLKGVVRALLPFVENLVAFIPFFMLNNRAVGSQYFGNLDFYLLYVLLFAIVYGQQQAIFSSLLAVGGYCFRQMYQRSGFDVMLDYNTYVWMAQLLILGLAVGYMRDQLRLNKEEQSHEVDYLSKKIDNIADINVSNMRVKEILSDQIINQNDSLGKLYDITSRLDKYEPEEVLFYAAEVLAKVMGSKDAAIYTVANKSYARLFSFTSAKARSMGNSIRYTDMDEMYQALKQKKVYINKNLNEKYPLMANAIYAGEEMQLILMVWGIPWERMTLGQANMLTVTGYLIQNAVLNANRYMQALAHERYIEGTQILEEKAFRSLVKAYLNAGAKHLTECVLIGIGREGFDLKEMSDGVKPLMRQTDYLGVMEDGKVYALLANTTVADAEPVCRRFEEEGYHCEVQKEIAV